MALWLLVFAAKAQISYSIDSFIISSGGETSTGGVYSVSATIGQPEASDAVKGREKQKATEGFTLACGF